MKRTISLVLVLAMVFTAMLGVVSFGEATDTTETTGTLAITSQNLAFEDAVYPLFAVDYTAVYTGDTALADAQAAVKLEIYKGETLVATLDAVTDEDLGNADGTVAFKFTNIGFKDMGTTYTLKAVNGVEENASVEYSYCVLEYALISRSSDNEALVDVVDAMLAVGAAAQKAFPDEIGEDDYDLSKEYGMAYVGGATQHKIIGAIGELVWPVAKSSIGTDATLYDMSFTEVEQGAFYMEEGMNRYFFYGGANNYYGNSDKLNLDMDMYTGDTVSYDYKYGATDTTANPQNRYLNVSNGVMTVTNTSSGGYSMQGAVKPESVTSSYSGNLLRVYGAGYLYWNAEASSTGMNFNNSSANFGALKVNDGCVTVAFSLAKITDVSLPTNGPRMRASGTSDVYYLWKRTSSTSAGIKAGGDSSNSKTIVTLNEVDVLNGAVPTADDFKTFYLVFDIVNETLTCYDQNGVATSLALDATPGTATSGWDAWTDYSNGCYMNWSIAANCGLIVNRITWIAGNPFA